MRLPEGVGAPGYGPRRRILLRTSRPTTSNPKESLLCIQVNTETNAQGVGAPGYGPRRRSTAVHTDHRIHKIFFNLIFGPKKVLLATKLGVGYWALVAGPRKKK